MPLKKCKGMRSTSTERSKKYREKVKADPAKHAEYLAREKLRYASRKVSLKIKTIDQMSTREQRNQRKEWKIRQRKSRLNEISTEKSNIEGSTAGNESEISFNFQQSSSGRKKLRKDRAKAYREINKLKNQIEKLNKVNQKLRKRESRHKIYSKSHSSPGTKVKQQLKGSQVKTPVKRTLLFHHALMDELSETYQGTKGVKENNIWSRLVAGRILRKYKVQHFAKFLGWNGNHLKSRKRLSTTSPFNYLRKQRSNATTTAMREQIKNFFSRDDNSRQTAGKKETITRHKVKLQKRILMDTCKNLHCKFLSEHQNCRVSYSSFLRLRPFHVIEQSVENRETCLCKTCDNLQLKAKKLYIEGVFKSSILQDISEIMCCGAGIKDCMYRDCLHCKNAIIPIPAEIDSSKQIIWQKWESATEIRTRDSKTKHDEYTVHITRKVEEAGTVEDLRDDFVKDFHSKGMKHLFNIKHQYGVLRSMKDNISDKEVVLHIDFAENYNCKLSGEIQSYHFGASRNQVTMHNGVAYTSTETLSFSTLSSSLRHDPSAIWAYLKPVISWISTLIPDLEIIRFISDSPATQYRCKNNFWLFSNLIYEYCPNTLKIASWDYLEAGHGKGAADGVGGVLKRSADQLVSHGLDLPDAKSVYTAISKDQQSTIKVFFVDPSEILYVDEKLPSNLPTLTGTMKIHQLLTLTTSVISHRCLSCYCNNSVDKLNFCPCYNPGMNTVQKLSIYNSYVNLCMSVWLSG